MREAVHEEQRAYRRFKAKEGVFTVIKKINDPKLTVAQVIDISQGGMSFKYIAGSEPVSGAHMLDIYFAGHGMQLKDMRFRVVSDIGLESPFPSSSVLMNRQGLKFLDMSNDQTSQLNVFIAKFTE